MLPLENGCNFRDLGGYHTIDGYQVRHGHIYRSGVLSYLSETDRHHLNDLGILTIFDLRRPSERQKEPTKWPCDTTELLVCDELNQHYESARQLRHSDTPELAHQAMQALYRAMSDWITPRIRIVFKHILDGKTPLLFHCSAGKDRTGLIAALLLYSLGVSIDDILHDYRLTNQCVDLEVFLAQHRDSGLGLNSASNLLHKLSSSARQALLAADESYLCAAFGEIEKKHGSLDNYLALDVGLTQTNLNHVRKILLTNIE